jgi:hypothetical protein
MKTEKQKYIVNCYDHNGEQRPTTVFAKNLRGAKILAYRYASGSTNYVSVEGPDGFAERTATDSFWGFCKGANPWN